MKQNPMKMDLWPSKAPHSNGLSGDEQKDGKKITNISTAQLYIFSPEPENTTGVAVIIFPGGGFSGVNLESMGFSFAKWLNQIGITAIVVKYRMPMGNPIIITEDAEQAVKMTLQNAERWGIDCNKTGICGFSIGGNSVSWICRTLPEEKRPKFQILFYPVESMREGLTHNPSRLNFLGKHATEEIINKFSNELHISDPMPPTFIALSDDDPVVPPAATAEYYRSLKEKHTKAAMYIFPEGGHGWAFDSDFSYLELCKELLYKWLKPLV